MPFLVPTTIEVDTARHVGEPKFLLPASVNNWLFNFLSLVHLTTSHGGAGVSLSLMSNIRLLVNDTFRLCVRKAGDAERGDGTLMDEDIRDWNLRSKGLKDGVGLFSRGQGAVEGTMPLPVWDEIIEP